MSINNCDRCGRELIDPQAQYGWRCEKIMGDPPRQRTIKEDLPALYQAGVNAANDFLNRYKIDPKLVDPEMFYEATSKYFLAKSLDNSEMCRKALLEAYDAFGFVVDRIDPQIVTSNNLSSMYAVLLQEWLENAAEDYSPHSSENDIETQRISARWESAKPSSYFAPAPSWIHPLESSDSPIVNLAREDALKAFVAAIGVKQFYSEIAEKCNDRKLATEYAWLPFTKLAQFGLQFGSSIYSYLKNGVSPELGSTLADALNPLSPPGADAAFEHTISKLDDHERRDLAYAEAKRFVENSEYRFLVNGLNKYALEKVEDKLLSEVKNATAVLDFYQEYPSKDALPSEKEIESKLHSKGFKPVNGLAFGFNPNAEMETFLNDRFDQYNKMGDVAKTVEYYTAYREQLMRIIIINDNRDAENIKLNEELGDIYSKYRLKR